MVLAASAKQEAGDLVCELVWQANHSRDVHLVERRLCHCRRRVLTYHCRHSCPCPPCRSSDPGHPWTCSCLWRQEIWRSTHRSASSAKFGQSLSAAWSGGPRSQRSGCSRTVGDPHSDHTATSSNVECCQRAPRQQGPPAQEAAPRQQRPPARQEAAAPCHSARLQPPKSLADPSCPRHGLGRLGRQPPRHQPWLRHSPRRLGRGLRIREKRARTHHGVVVVSGRDCHKGRAGPASEHRRPSPSSNSWSRAGLYPLPCRLSR